MKQKFRPYVAWKSMAKEKWKDKKLHFDGDSDFCEALVEDENGPLHYYPPGEPWVKCRSVGEWDGEEGVLV